MKRRVLLYGLIVLFTFYEAMVYESFTPSVLLLFEVLLVPVLMGMAWLQAKTLKLSAVWERTDCFVGETDALQVTLENAVPWPVVGAEIWVEVTYGKGEKTTHKTQSFSLIGRSKKRFVIPLSLPFCGIAEVALQDCRVYDCLGVFHWKKRWHWSFAQKVQPRPVFVNLEELRMQPVIGQDGSLYYADRSGYDNSEIYQVRDYREGDRLSAVHWKLSAKSGNLLVKEFSLPRKSSYLLMLDGRCQTQEEFHRRVTTLLSVSKTMAAQDVVHTVAWFDEGNGQPRERMIQSSEDYQRIVEELIALSWENATLFPLSIYERFFPQVQYVKLFFVTGIFSEREADLVYEYRGAMRKALLLLEEATKQLTWKELEIQCFTGEVLEQDLEQLPILLSM